MNNIKLKQGFLVDDWDGKIEEVSYFEGKYNDFGVDDYIFYFTKDGVMHKPLSRYNSKKIFDSKREADKHSAEVVENQIKYFKKQANEYLERAKSIEK